MIQPTEKKESFDDSKGNDSTFQSPAAPPPYYPPPPGPPPSVHIGATSTSSTQFPDAVGTRPGPTSYSVLPYGSFSSPPQVYPVGEVPVQGNRVMEGPHNLIPICWTRQPNFSAQHLIRFNPVVIKSNSPSLSESFPLIFPDSGLLSYDVMMEDWARFIEDIGLTARMSTNQNTISGILPITMVIRGIKNHMNKKESEFPAVSYLVERWNVQFFGPRHIRVTLRPEWATLGRNHDDASSISSSTMSSGSNSSSYDLQQRSSPYPPASHPIGVSPSMPGPSHLLSIVGDHVQGKFERKVRKAQRKYDRKVQKVERKASKQAVKYERKEIKRQEKDARKAHRTEAEMYGRYDLIIECI